MLIQEPLDALQSDYLHQIGWLQHDEEIVEFKKAGEGNMNVVIWVLTNKKSFILKQSRPYVAKYPQVPAPQHRIGIEKSYYETVANHPTLSEMSPKVLEYDPSNWLMALEFFPDCQDLTSIYSGKQGISPKILGDLTSYLKALHTLKVKDFPENLEMKALNHQHIFELPFQKENGLDLEKVQKGLRMVSRPIIGNNQLVAIVERLGKRYLSKGNYLLHGDFYPGSWLKVGNQIKVIDTEFSFLGDREFDLGVMIAHLLMAETEMKIIDDLLGQYGLEDLDKSLLSGYTGTEILRRLFGLAQLPLKLDLKKKEKLADKATDMIINGKIQ
ncbi:MAG: phosphotransferase [Cyclobacteriaceae bacterium]